MSGNQHTSHVVTDSYEKSMVPGVHRQSWGNTWFGQFKFQKIPFYIGTYRTREEAEQAVIDRRTELNDHSFLNRLQQLKSSGIRVGTADRGNCHDEEVPRTP